MYPTIKENPDYTSIVNQRHYDRINSYLDDAKQKGAKIVEINPANEDFSQQPTHKIPPTIVVNPTDDMKVMQDEIFGPVLPVKSYRSVTEVLDYVNGHARPLGLYYFGEDEKEERTVLDRTTSGGVTVNDVIMHVSMEDLPFGGVGPSGMGAYHGIDGFRTFSHAKAVYKQSNAKMVAEMFRPPYTSKSRKRLMGMIKK
jgi:coniferyl-aldehyde dehydrogenase